MTTSYTTTKLSGIIEDNDMYERMIWFLRRALESKGRRRIPSGGCSGSGSGSVVDDDDAIMISWMYKHV